MFALNRQLSVTLAVIAALVAALSVWRFVCARRRHGRSRAAVSACLVAACLALPAALLVHRLFFFVDFARFGPHYLDGVYPSPDGTRAVQLHVWRRSGRDDSVYISGTLVEDFPLQRDREPSPQGARLVYWDRFSADDPNRTLHFDQALADPPQEALPVHWIDNDRVSIGAIPLNLARNHTFDYRRAGTNIVIYLEEWD